MSDEAEILALASERVGTVLHGKYQLDGVLGVGGMATVYAATHRNRKRFAVKMLHPEYSVRRDVRTRFVREGYLANSVDHPGVVAVLDDDVDETGSAFLVMELLEGFTVEALYASGNPLPVREALGITHQLLDVLEAAHEKSVIHRDIKPANLFVLRAGQLKVLDFGIARLREVDAGQKSTRTGATLGTPAFMAPEQARAMPSEIDARTDLWGAGATLFTMLSARFVHPGENARQIMIRAATEPARSLESLMPELPAPVLELVARALRFERSERWPSAAAMREAVLAAFRELFHAEPSHSDLSELVARTSVSVETSRTEPSPLTGIEPRSPQRRSSRPMPAARGQVPAIDERVQTTASTPVSTRGDDSARKPRWLQLAVLAGAVTLLGVWMVTYFASQGDVQPAASSAPAPSATPVRAVVAEPPATLSAPVPQPSAVAATSSPALVVQPRLKPPTVGKTEPPRTDESQRAKRPAPSASTLAATPGPVLRAPENPLKLELQ